jgi:hypothetical protein
VLHSRSLAAAVRDDFAHRQIAVREGARPVLSLAARPKGDREVGRVIVLLDTSDDLAQAGEELGTRRRNRGGVFGVDNGAYATFDGDGLLSLLEREQPNRDRCLFVAVPDVVGSARRTLECFEHWADRLAGWPLALVAQDGQEDLTIPWTRIEAVFIGGSTVWKMSDAAEQVMRAAQVMGKHVHVGRVNTPSRMTRFQDLGVDTCDGTGISRFSWMRRAVADRQLQPALLEACMS